MSNWLDKIMPSKIRSDSKQRTGVPEGLWKKCPKCGAFLYKPELDKNLDVCPKCQHHLRVTARRRLDIFLDKDGRQEIAADLEPWDRLKFKDGKRYKDRLTQNQKATGEKDALVAMRGTCLETPLVAVAFEFHFMGGWPGCGREVCPGSQRVPGRTDSPGVFLCQWWRANAGSHPVADADVEDRCGA